MTDELNEITFCDECPYSGEPNGCNRKGGVCRAHDYCFDLRDERDALKAENAVLKERLEKAVLNHNVYYIASIWNDATLTRTKEVNCKTVDYVCDKFVECGGLILNWDEIYFTRDAALARLAELNQK